jgi:hypothetical protein
LDRLDRDGQVVTVVEPIRSIAQFPVVGDDRGGTPQADVHDVALTQRPPAISRPEYAERDSVRG